jgi:hypothetical protein
VVYGKVSARLDHEGPGARIRMGTIMKRKSLKAATVAAITGGLLFAGIQPAQASQGVYHYPSLAACSQAADRYAQHGTIYQYCTVDAYINDVPYRWRLIVDF